MIKHIRIGSRTSPLAIVQSEKVKASILKFFPDIKITIIPMKTTGDIILDKPLAEVGGKGLFTKELDRALYDDACDIAVHSLKDVETRLPLGTEITSVCPRENPNDVLISNNIKLKDLPVGAVIGTCSLRRKAQILRKRPDAKVVMLRGNVQTRLKKVKDGEVDATFLAQAGLERLGLESEITEILDKKFFIPAVGQGCIAIQKLKSRTDLDEILQAVNCQITYEEVACERAMLDALDGTCKTPVGGYAEIDGEMIHLSAFASTEDGKTFVHVQESALRKNAIKLGKDTGEKLRQSMGSDFDKM